jgi:hypothetical protein
MKLFIIGATGNIGSCICNEALSRGHQVTGMTRNSGKIRSQSSLAIYEGNVTDTAKLAEAIKGHNAVIVSHGSAPTDPKIGPNTILAANSIIDALREAGIKRVFWVGGAGSLFNSEGKRVFDAMELPAWARSAIWSMAALLMHLQTIEDLDWSFLSPARMIGPGKRTGTFRLGLDELVVGADGNSSISYEDYAVAAINELENPQHIRRRFTLGY